MSNKIKPDSYFNGGNHTPERLDKTLEYFEKSGLLTTPTENRRVSKPNRSEKDPYARAKYVTEKMRRFFEDCMVDEGLVEHEPVAGVSAPMVVIYTIELLWLNIVNADNIPATPEEIDQARKAAFAYYEKYKT